MLDFLDNVLRIKAKVWMKKDGFPYIFLWKLRAHDKMNVCMNVLPFWSNEIELATRYEKVGGIYQ